jgi:osmotically-inducible protein OsmY
MLGAAFWGGLSSAEALRAPETQEMPHEIVVMAPKDPDAALTVKMAAALREDSYIFADHVTITTENGVIHMRGMVSDLSSLFDILRLARRIAGQGRVVNEIEFVPVDFDGN